MSALRAASRRLAGDAMTGEAPAEQTGHPAHFSARLNDCSRQRRVFAARFDDKIRIGINIWRNAVIQFTRLGLTAATATVALGLVIGQASAQTTPAAPAPAAPAAKAPPAKAPPAAAAPKAAAPAPAPAPAAAKAPAKEAPAKAATPAKTTAAKGSVCKGLDEAGCGSNADCQWIVPQKANKATGKVATSYCKLKPKPKGAAAAKAAPTAAAAPAPAKAAAPAPAAAAPAKK
jgi:hypothetical protein